MMNVSADVLENLKCSNCDYYLSCGPVYIKHEDGEAICGRCSKPEEEPVTQNKQYEAVAQLLRFPCKHSEFGCQEKLKFSKNQNPHEETCNFRKRLCPIAERGTCDWLGTWKNLLEHCKDNHPELVLENPCSIRHDISKSRLINYLLVAFNLLFVLHTKVCCTSGKIFHAIRFLGEAQKAKDFEYQLDIKQNKEQLSKCGVVAPEGCLAIQENSSLSISINNLLEFFGGFDNTIFYIKLKQLTVETVADLNFDFSAINVNNQNILQTKVKSFFSSFLVKCIQCENVITNNFKFGEMQLCDNCKLFVKCCENRNKGCAYFDVQKQCLKHETYFCEFITQCSFCKLSLRKGEFLKHLELKHWYLKKTLGQSFTCYSLPQMQFLVDSDIGTIIVEHSISADGISTLKIFTPLSSKELQSHSCKTITNGYVWQSVNNKFLEDWSFTASGQNIVSFFDTKIDISKKR